MPSNNTTHCYIICIVIFYGFLITGGMIGTYYMSAKLSPDINGGGISTHKTVKYRHLNYAFNIYLIHVLARLWKMDCHFTVAYV
jgi:hypothetical protein